MKKHISKLLPAILGALLLLVGCQREGSTGQKNAFDQAVALESTTQSIPDRQAAYMNVV